MPTELTYARAQLIEVKAHEGRDTTHLADPLVAGVSDVHVTTRRHRHAIGIIHICSGGGDPVPIVCP